MSLRRPGDTIRLHSCRHTKKAAQVGPRQLRAPDLVLKSSLVLENHCQPVVIPLLEHLARRLADCFPVGDATRFNHLHHWHSGCPSPVRKNRCAVGILLFFSSCPLLRCAARARIAGDNHHEGSRIKSTLDRCHCFVCLPCGPARARTQN